jgi:hypothetical protein
MDVWPASLRRLLRRARQGLGDHPVFLPIVLALTPERFDRAITAGTELVVEGFPRSGNTFAAAAIEVAQQRTVSISSHVHVPAQVKRAVRKHVPTLVVIRDPLDAVASLIVAAPHVLPRSALREYAHHYTELMACRGGVVIGTFDEVTTGLAGVIDRINARFDTHFARFEPTDANLERVRTAIEERYRRVHGGHDRALPLPAAARADRLDQMRRRLGAPELAAELARARDVFRAFTAPGERSNGTS